MKSKLLAIFGIVLLSVALVLPSAVAEVLDLNLDTEFSGADMPEASLTARFEDTEGGVLLTLGMVNPGPYEFVRNWYFNVDPSLDLSLLSFSTVSGQMPSYSVGTDAFKADGDGLYDVKLSYSTNMNQYPVTLKIGSTQQLSVSSFKYLSTWNGGANTNTWAAAAHVQGIQTSDADCSGSGSGWVGAKLEVVPEPVSSALFLIGGGALALIRRKKA